jgi:hypothetical protein
VGADEEILPTMELLSGGKTQTKANVILGRTKFERRRVEKIAGILCDAKVIIL